MNPFDLVGKFYKFEDGNKIEVFQVKKTDEERGSFLITYLTYTGPGIPRKLVLPFHEFKEHYGHLFNIDQ
jgi:hypothetical protein